MAPPKLDPNHVAPHDLTWAIERLNVLETAADYEASRHSLKLLKGYGYPNEVMSHAQDVLAILLIKRQLEQWARFIVREVEGNTYGGSADRGRMKHRDHACRQCLEYDGEIVIPGFVCSYHTAKAFIAALENGDQG